MAMIVTLKDVNGGFYKVEIKREIGTDKEVREFTKKALNEYLESARSYCKNKGYEFIYEVDINSETKENTCSHEKVESIRTENGIIYRCMDCAKYL